MNIWIVNHYFVPPKQAGGTRHYSLARYLVEQGHQVQIIAANFNHYTKTYIEASDNPVNTSIDGIDVLWLPTPSYQANTTVGRLRNMLSFAKSCRRHARNHARFQPDVIIGSSPHLFAALAANRLAKHYRVPFVLEVRDLWPESLVVLSKVSRYHPAIIAFKALEIYLYRQAAQIITLLPNAKDYFARYGVANDKVQCIPNFFDPTLFASQPPSSENASFTLMYVGSHGLANNLDLLVDAAKELEQQHPDSNIKIQLIGDGPEKARLQQKAAGLRCIEFCPAVAKSQVPSCLAAADACVLLLFDSDLYRWGMSANKLFDYMASAKPIILIGQSANNPIAELQSGVHIAEQNPKLLADAIATLATTSKTELAAMGQRNRQYASEHHQLPVVGRQLVDVLLAVSSA